MQVKKHVETNIGSIGKEKRQEPDIGRYQTLAFLYVGLARVPLKGN